MTFKQRIFLTLFILLGVQTSAKITCDFVADTTRACAPKQISFTDLSTSTSGSITYWSWSFGNGGFSNLQNPSRVYTTPGVYTVTLTVSDGTDTCTITKNAYLTLFKSPVADFSSVTVSKCTPVEVNFTDKTILGDAPIRTYKWDYGDLTPTGTGKISTHKYKFPGTYSVLFTVIDTNGCASTSAPFNIPVGSPKANFSGTPRDDCLPPLKTVFNNLSTSRNPTTYFWIFGDGNTSTQKNPSNKYINSGNYDVTLVVTDKYGCKDTLKRTKYVNIGAIKANFKLPDTLCINSFDSLINTSVGGKFFKWKFGNGGTSNQRNAVVSFSKEGYTTITLIASSDTNCVDSITKTVYIEKITADFDIVQKDICDPNSIEFRDKSTGNISSVSYHLDMGTRLNHVYSNKKIFNFIYPKSYCKTTKWKVIYTVRSKSGCENTKTKYVEIFNGQLVGNVKSTSTCVPSDFTFDVTPCLKTPAIKWSWNFNTGNPADTSNLKKPTNVIRKTKGGSYFATVTAIDSNGCKFEQKVPYVVGEKQKANFVMSDDTICVSDTLYLTNLSTDKTKIDKQTWSFGDLTYSGLYNSKHKYVSQGRYKVKLTVWNNNCKDTLSKFVFVGGVLASIITNPDCKNPLNQKFTAGIVGNYTRFYWDFGDSTTLDSTNLSVTHVYSHYGKRKITLTVIDDATGCTDVATMTITPQLLKAHFSTNTIQICKGGDIQFDATRSIGIIGGRFFWNFGDGQKDRYISRIKHRYNKSGKLNVQLIVFSSDSCSDTTYRQVAVASPNPYFKLNSPIICSGDSLSIPNLATPDTTILSYEWFYGNSIISTTKDMNKKFVLPKSTIDTTKLVNVDSADIRLLMTDILGCREDYGTQLKVIQVKAIFEITDSTLCRGDEITFLDKRLPSPVNHFWMFGNGDTSTVDEPKYTYNNSGDFLAKYVVSQAPCFDTLAIPISVQGIDSVGFSSSLTDTNCYPAQIYFNDYSLGDSIIWRTWDFGDGIASIRSPLKDSLTKTFLNPGIFDIKIIVETSNGCKDSVTYKKHIEIRGPYSRFSVTPDSICIFEPITFIHDTSNIYTYSLTWDFADGRVDITGTNVDSLHHKYSRVGILNTVLLFEDSSGECKKFFTKEVVIEDVHAIFDYDVDSIGCQPFSTNFKDRSLDGDTWSWSFGDGNKSVAQHPGNTWKKAGKYLVNLIYSNTRNGCKDTTFREIEVLPLPNIRGNGDTTICVGDTVQLNADGALSYVWAPDYNITSTTLRTPKAAPDQSITYSLTGIDTNNCSNKTDVNVFVQQIPIVKMPDQKLLIVGEEFQIIPNIEYGGSYRWDPPTGLSCSDCPDPYARPLKSTTYTLYVNDTLGCFETTRSFIVEVEVKYSLDIPDVFTPNGDGSNDVISPAGWGLKNVLEFKVFNRWGELVFEATQDTPGWDGYYKGELQNMETYVYYVKALTYEDDVLTKEGYFTLVR